MDGNNMGFTCSLNNFCLYNTKYIKTFFHYSDLINDYDE